jgi:hypothetical protein
MAKKKNHNSKKSQKPVETQTPLDFVPTNTGDPVPDALEIQMPAEPAEPAATDAMSGEQSVLSASKVEPLEATIPKPLETSTSASASSTHLDSSPSVPHKAAAPLAAQSPSAAEQDPPMEREQQLDPQIAHPKATQSTTNEIEHSSYNGLDDKPDAGSILDQEPPLQDEQKEQEAIQPIEDLDSTLVLSGPQLAQAPDLLAEPQLHTTSPAEPVVVMAPEVVPEDFAPRMPTEAEAPAIQEDQPEMATGERRTESPQPVDFDAPVAPTTPVAPEVPEVEPTESAEIVDGTLDSEPVQEMPSTHQIESQSLPDIDNDLENPTTDEPFEAVEDQPIPPQAMEAPCVPIEPHADAVSEENIVEPATEPEILSHGEMNEAPTEIQTAHEEPCHQDGESTEDNQVEQNCTMEKDDIPADIVQDAQEKDAEVFWPQERLDQESGERERRKHEEAEALGLLQELEHEIHAEQTRNQTEAAGVAEQTLEEPETETPAQTESERKQQEGAIRERIERETLEQVFEAKRLLALMEQEIRATEAQDEIEKAALAERAKRENEQLEYKQMQRERLEQQRRDMEARMAASGITSAQKEADQVEAARRAIEGTSRARILNGVGARPMPSSPAQERWPADELPRARTPPSAGRRAHDRSPSQSDRPFRSYRSFAPHARKLRTQEAGPNYPPKPYSVSHFLEDDIPAAPSPPMSRVQPRYVPVQSRFLVLLQPCCSALLRPTPLHGPYCKVTSLQTPERPNKLDMLCD